MRFPSKPFPSRGSATAGLALIIVALAAGGSAGASPNEAGKVAYGLGDYVTAERLFRQAVGQAPENPLYRYHLAVALTGLSRWREAAAQYEATLRLAPPPALGALARDGLGSLAPLLRTPRSPVTSHTETEIPLRAVAGGWLVEVVLNDSRSARFLVGTGASICVISPDLARALRLEPRAGMPAVALQTLAGRTSAPMVTIPSIRAGDSEAEEVAAAIQPVGSGFEGILGNSFLARFAVMVDPARAVLTLRSR